MVSSIREVFKHKKNWCQENNETNQNRNVEMEEEAMRRIIYGNKRSTNEMFLNSKTVINDT
jgi:hypothetical protein